MFYIQLKVEFLKSSFCYKKKKNPVAVLCKHKKYFIVHSQVKHTFLYEKYKIYVFLIKFKKNCESHK